MKLDKTIISCGIYQLEGVSDEPPEDVVKFVKKTLLSKEVTKKHDWAKAHARPPAIIFSDSVMDSCYSGKALAKYIKKNKLGKVVATETFYNASVLKNHIIMWIWYLDYKALEIDSLLENYV